MIGIDELQNIHMENIPVIEECYTKSDYQYGVYSGTPRQTSTRLSTTGICRPRANGC